MEKKSPHFSEEEFKDVLRFHKKRQLQQHWETLMEEENETDKKNEAKVVSLPPQKTPKRWLWGIAASVALLIACITVWMLVIPAQNSPQAVVAANIESLAEFPTKGATLSNNQQIVKELNQFKKKELSGNLTKADFKTIIQLVNTQEEQIIKDNGFYLTRAYAYLKTGQYQAAIEDLNKYINDGQWTTDTAQYYLALSYIGIGDLDAAIGILNQLKSEQPKKVNKLLQQIEALRK